MTRDPQPPPRDPGAADELQFDRVEPAPPLPSQQPQGLGEPVPVNYATPPGAGVSACAACREPITDVYFEGNGKVVCPRCRNAVLAAQSRGSGLARFLKATAYGILGGIVGATIWWAVGEFLHVRSGYVAVIVGLLVGGAVKAGANRRGGLGYQLLAVALTYLTIAGTYVPDILREIHSSSHGGTNVVALVILTAVIAIVAPFLGGVSNLLGLLIIGIALWFAWKINRSEMIRFNGPYRLAPAAGATTGAAFAPAGLGYAPPPTPGNYGPPPPAGRA